MHALKEQKYDHLVVKGWLVKVNITTGTVFKLAALLIIFKGMRCCRFNMDLLPVTETGLTYYCFILRNCELNITNYAYKAISVGLSKFPFNGSQEQEDSHC